jgi:hypothetical protein
MGDLAAPGFSWGQGFGAGAQPAGFGPTPSSAPSVAQPSSPGGFGNSYVNPGYAGLLMRAAALAPGPVGAAAMAGAGLLNGYNSITTNRALGHLGLPGLGPLGLLGGILGVNSYGSGTPEGLAAALAARGVTADSAASLFANAAGPGFQAGSQDYLTRAPWGMSMNGDEGNGGPNSNGGVSSQAGPGGMMGHV